MLRSYVRRGLKASAFDLTSPHLSTSESTLQSSQFLKSSFSNNGLLRPRRGWGGGRAYSPSKALRKGGVEVETAENVVPTLPPLRTGLSSWYVGMLHKYPVLTKSVTASTIYTCADATSQVISNFSQQSNSKEGLQWDIQRISRMAAFGFFLSGPSLHFWFNFLSRVLPKRDMTSTIKKMLMGQILYGPFFTSIFFSLNAFAQGETGTEVMQRLKRDLLPTLGSGLMYWPLCDLVTFRYIPVHLQPLVSNSFSFIWTVYLTYMASLKKVSDNPNAMTAKKVLGSPNLEKL